MTDQDRKDISALCESYRRNLPALIRSLRKCGQPEGWLSSWRAKLDRLEKSAKGQP